MNGHSSVHMNGSQQPMMLRRMSPVPGRPVSSVPVVTRGQSPVTGARTPTVAPLVVNNSLEVQAQVAHQMQALSIFSSDNQTEPPPPYPMGTAAMASGGGGTAPPSYSQTIAMRQSPTLSSASSEYRRSPLLAYPNMVMVAGSGMVAVPNGIANHPASPLPAPTAPSPVNSILSGSSRSSWSSQAFSARQAKTHSPVIMQSVKSTQVQKPVLQQAHGVAHGVATVPGHSPVEATPPALVPRSGQVTAAGQLNHCTAAPPSYFDSIQPKKSSGPPTPVPPAVAASPVPMSSAIAASPIPTTCPPSYNASLQARPGVSLQQRGLSPAGFQAPSELPAPPPYPSTAVSKHEQHCADPHLVSATPIMARNSPVINTAKVVPNNANLVRTMETKSGQAMLQRKYSPHLSETSSTTSRSDSPVSAASDCPTISASPVQFMSGVTPSNAMTLGHDSGIVFSGDRPVQFMSGVTPGNAMAMGDDSGIVFSGDQEMAPPPPPPYKTVHYTSPKPERKTYSREQDELRIESKIKKYPPQAFKFFMEQHVENVVKYYDDRRKRRMQLEKEMVELEVDEKKQELYRKVLAVKESNFIRLKRGKMNKSQFKKIKTIGLGAFGTVHLVKKVDGAMNHMNINQEQMFAMKTLKKSEVLMRNQVAHVKAERDILAEADNDWIVKLYHSFQVRSYFWSKLDLNLTFVVAGYE